MGNEIMNHLVEKQISDTKELYNTYNIWGYYLEDASKMTEAAEKYKKAEFYAQNVDERSLGLVKISLANINRKLGYLPIRPNMPNKH